AAPPVLREVVWQRLRHLVPVPRIVPVILGMAADLAGVDVERDHRRGVEVVARVHVAGPWRGIAGAPETQVELRVVVCREPYRDSARLPRVGLPRLVTRLARAWNRVGLPHRLAIVSVEGGDVSPDAELAARRADHHLALGDERRQREVVAILVVVDG